MVRLISRKSSAKLRQTAITFILGLIIFYIFQRKAYIWKQMDWLKEWKYRVICSHSEDFIFFFFFFFSFPEPLDYIIIIKAEANFLGLSLKSHRGGSKRRKWFAKKKTSNTEADLIDVWLCWSAGTGWQLLILMCPLVFLFITPCISLFSLFLGSMWGIYVTGSSLSFSNPCSWPAHFWKRQTKNGKMSTHYPLWGEETCPGLYKNAEAEVGRSIGPPVPQS